MSDIYLLSNVPSMQKDIINLPIFDINFINPNIDITIYDALIFTSKNAIYSLEDQNINYHKIPCFAIAPKTAQILKDYNANLVYTGISGHGDDFANEIKDKLIGKKVLYIRAKKIVSNLMDILKCDDTIVYETVCKNHNEKTNINDNAKIIFTSPSTINCFFQNYTWNKTYTAICIGNTTASYLPKDIQYFISKETSITSCIELARTI